MSVCTYDIYYAVSLRVWVTFFWYKLCSLKQSGEKIWKPQNKINNTIIYIENWGAKNMFIIFNIYYVYTF